MAIFKLGAIITDIVGSIGGTTFRRGTTTASMYNKTGGAPSNKLFQNLQLGPISVIFRKWGFLSQSIRDAWAYQATLFAFPDTFGEPKFLTGRQLFSKLNIQLLPAALSISDPTGMTSFTNAFTVKESFIGTVDRYAAILLDTNTGSNLYYVQAEVSAGHIHTPTFTARKVIAVRESGGTSVLQISEEFFENFPYFNIDYSCIFYVTAINSYGFKSVTQYSSAEVAPE